MQNDDTHGSDQTQDGLDTVGQPAEHWAHADSVSGYGRPDPDEFGLPYPDQGLDPLIQELSPVQEQAATFQFGQPTEPIAEPVFGARDRHTDLGDRLDPDFKSGDQVLGSALGQTADQLGAGSELSETMRPSTSGTGHPTNPDADPTDLFARHYERVTDTPQLDLSADTGSGVTSRAQPLETSRPPETDNTGVDLWTGSNSGDHPGSGSLRPIKADEPIRHDLATGTETRLESGSETGSNGHHSFSTSQLPPMDSHTESGLGPLHPVPHDQPPPPNHLERHLEQPVVQLPQQPLGFMGGEAGRPGPALESSEPGLPGSAGQLEELDPEDLDAVDAAKGGEGDETGGTSPAPASRARSPKTERLYDRYSRYLWKRSVAKRSPDPQQPVVVNPIEVTMDLIDSRNTVPDGSWRAYRAGLLWYLAQRRQQDPLYEEAYHLLAGVKLSGSTVAKKRKASAKRVIPEAHLFKLTDELNAMNRHVHWGSRTHHWLMAGLACGARPREWIGASWLDDAKTILCIPNGKRKMTAPIYTLVEPGQTIHDVEAEHPEKLTPGTKLDESKRIRNVEIEPKDVGWIEMHMKSLNAHLDQSSDQQERENLYDAYYNMCRKYLREACVRAFDGKKQYPLYVMRSQYAANIKAEFPLEDVAARMGHESSGRTTMKDYGPRSAAHGGRGAHTPAEAQARADARRQRKEQGVGEGEPSDRPEAA